MKKGNPDNNELWNSHCLAESSSKCSPDVRDLQFNRGVFEILSFGDFILILEVLLFRFTSD